MNKLLAKLLGVDVEQLRTSFNSAIVSHRHLQQQYDELQRVYTGLQERYNELVRMYGILRDEKVQPAPDDGPWQMRFVELEREFDTYRKERAQSIRENWTSSANFREAKIHYREFLKYMECE